MPPRIASGWKCDIYLRTPTDLTRRQSQRALRVAHLKRSAEKMKRVVCLVMITALAVGGCNTNIVIAVPDPMANSSNSATAKWRLRLDGIDYVYTGGIPGSATDVKKVTPFFLIPADAYDSKILVLELAPDGGSVHVGGVAFAGSRESAISEARIFRFIQRADQNFDLQVLSDPLPAQVTRMEMLDLLSACLNRKISEAPNKSLQPTPGS